METVSKKQLEIILPKMEADLAELDSCITIAKMMDSPAGRSGVRKFEKKRALLAGAIAEVKNQIGVN